MRRGWGKNFKTLWVLSSSDVNRGQNLEAETEAEARVPRPRPRSRPEFWGQGRGRGRGQFLEVEAKAEAKEKVMNKKLSNDCWPHTGEFISLWSKRHSLLLILLRIFYHSVMSCSRQSKLQTDWSVDHFLAAGSSAADRGQAEAKCLGPRPRPRPKLWGRDRGRGQNFGLEATLASRT